MAVALPLCLSQLGTAQLCMDYMPGSNGEKVPHVSMGLHLRLPIVPLVEAVARFAELQEGAGVSSSPAAAEPSSAAPASKAAPSSKDSDRDAVQGADSEGGARDSLGEQLDSIFRRHEEGNRQQRGQGTAHSAAQSKSEPVAAWKQRVRRVPKPHLLFGDGHKRAPQHSGIESDKDPYEVGAYFGEASTSASQAAEAAEARVLASASASSQAAAAAASDSRPRAEAKDGELGARPKLLSSPREDASPNEAGRPQLRQPRHPQAKSSTAKQKGATDSPAVGSGDSGALASEDAKVVAGMKEASDFHSPAQSQGDEEPQDIEPPELSEEDISRLLEALHGHWQGPDGSSYQVSTHTAGSSLTVKTKMPAGTVVTKRGMITVSSNRIQWSKGVGFVLACRPPPPGMELQTAPWKGARSVYRWERPDDSAPMARTQSVSLRDAGATFDEDDAEDT